MDVRGGDNIMSCKVMQLQAPQVAFHHEIQGASSHNTGSLSVTNSDSAKSGSGQPKNYSNTRFVPGPSGSPIELVSKANRVRMRKHNAVQRLKQLLRRGVVIGACALSALREESEAVGWTALAISDRSNADESLCSPKSKSRLDQLRQQQDRHHELTVPEHLHNSGLEENAVLGSNAWQSEHTAVAGAQLQATALWEYKAEEIGQLSLHKGDVLQVLEVLDNGWCDGLLGPQRGWFPSNHTKIESIQMTRASGRSSTALCDKEREDESALQQMDAAAITRLLSPYLKSCRSEESSAVHNTVEESRTVQAVFVRRGSELKPIEQRSDHEFHSEGELSFVGFRGNSGATTPTGAMSATCKNVALDLANKILSDFIRYQQFQQTPNSETCNAAGGSEGKSGDSSSSSSPSVISDWSKDTTVVPSNSSKRKLGRSGNSSDEDKNDDDDEGQPRYKKPRPETEDMVQLFACPFAKYDQERYSERNVKEREYRSCSSCLLRDIPRLKQHLYRVHKRPEHYCPSCFSAFKTRTLLDEHVRERSCRLAEPLYEEKMTVDQMKEIKRRSRGGSSQEQWFGIFKILFPGTPVPPSPYAGEDNETQTAIQHFVSFFRAYGPENFFDLVRDRQNIVQNLDVSTQEIVDEAFEITAPELLRQLRAERTNSSTKAMTGGQKPILTAALSAAESLLEKRQGTAPFSIQQAPVNSPAEVYDPGLWSAMSQVDNPNLLNCFDFESNFDPLTVDDAFASYGLWNI